MQPKIGTGLQVFTSRYEGRDLLTLLEGDYKFLVLGVYHTEAGLAVVSFPTKNFREFGTEKQLKVENSSSGLDLSTKEKAVIVNNVFDLAELRELFSGMDINVKNSSYLLFKPVFDKKYPEYLSYEVELVVEGKVKSAAGPRPCPYDCPSIIWSGK